MRGYRKNDLGLFCVTLMAGKESSKYRQLAESRDLVGRARIVVVDEAGEDLILPVLQPKYRRSGPGSDLICDRPLRCRQLVGDVAHFEVDLDFDFAVGRDNGRDFQFQSDIEVLDAFRYKTG